MSMFSSLDALEAATDATSAPRAAVFQPKVKPRARKGGAGRDNRSASAKPGPPALERAAEPSQIVTTPGDVTTASETPAASSGLPNPPPTIAQCVVDINDGSGEQSLALGDGAPLLTNDTDVSSREKSTPTVHVAAAPDDVFIAEADNVSSDEVRDERPPVAIRSNFPIPPTPPPTGLSSGETVELPATPLPETDPEPGVATARKFVSRVESDPLKVQNPNSGERPTGSKDEKVGSNRHVDEEPFKDADEDRIATCEEHAAEVEHDDAERVPEVVSTGKRSRKRAFSHSTSQPRFNRKEGEEVSPKVDLSKIDLAETDLSNPGKLTMREIIRRAEAIERKKMKVDGTKKKPDDPKQKQAAVVEAPEVSMAPEVQVINGRIVVNEQSLTIGAYATSRQNTDTYTRVEENASRLNYNSYSNRTRAERWKSEDTDVFYRALQQFGTDFELIQNLFPGRSRRQVKAKFKKEERSNPKRLQDALAHRPKDQLHYTYMINQLKANEPDPNGDDPFASMLAHANGAAAGEQTEIT